MIDEEECNSAIMESLDHQDVAIFESDSSETPHDQFIEVPIDKSNEPA